MDNNKIKEPVNIIINNNAKLSEEIFDHKLTWNSENKKSNICTSIGSILFNGTFLEDDFCDLARNYRF